MVAAVKIKYNVLIVITSQRIKIKSVERSDKLINSFSLTLSN